MGGGAFHHKREYDLTVQGSPQHLTEKEQEVLKLMSQGLAGKEMARALEISEQTIKNHATAIFRKFDVSNKIEAINMGYKLGYLNPAGRRMSPKAYGLSVEMLGRDRALVTIDNKKRSGR